MVCSGGLHKEAKSVKSRFLQDFMGLADAWLQKLSRNDEKKLSHFRKSS